MLHIYGYPPPPHPHPPDYAVTTLYTHRYDKVNNSACWLSPWDGVTCLQGSWLAKTDHMSITPWGCISVILRKGEDNFPLHGQRQMNIVENKDLYSWLTEKSDEQQIQVTTEKRSKNVIQSESFYDPGQRIKHCLPESLIQNEKFWDTPHVNGQVEQGTDLHHYYN